MSNIAVGNMNDFIGGFLQAEGDKKTRQDKIDDDYKTQWNKVNPQIAIDNAKEAYRTQREIEVNKAKQKQDQFGNDLVKFGADTNGFQGNYTQGQPVPGVPQGMDTGNQSIQPRTQPLQQQPPQPQQAQPMQQGQQPPALNQPPQQMGQAQPSAPPQGGLNSPQGGPVPLSGPGEPLEPAQQQQQEAPPTPSMSDIPPNAPVKQLIKAGAVANAPTPIDAYIGGLDPSLHEGARSMAMLSGAETPQELAALLSKRKEYAQMGETVDKFDSNVLKPFAEMKAKAAKNAAVDTSQWGSEDVASVSAMQREGILGNTSNIKPLSAGQKKDNDNLVQQAYQMKVAATQGIGTFARIVQDTSKINPGPGAETAAYIKNAWAQMTDTQRSSALTTFYEGQKEMVNALNAQVNSMRQVGGRFVVGANVLKLEERGIPDITKMPPEASLALAQGYINNYKQIIGQADAIINTPEDISPIKRIQFANAYAEKNPTFKEDGQTPNPEWKEFRQWRDSASTGPTGAAIRKQIDANTAGALSDAKAGGSGKVPEHIDPAIQQQVAPLLQQGWTLKKN